LECKIMRFAYMALFMLVALANGCAGSQILCPTERITFKFKGSLTRVLANEDGSIVAVWLSKKDVQGKMGALENVTVKYARLVQQWGRNYHSAELDGIAKTVREASCLALVDDDGEMVVLEKPTYRRANATATPLKVLLPREDVLVSFDLIWTDGWDKPWWPDAVLDKYSATFLTLWAPIVESRSPRDWWLSHVEVDIDKQLGRVKPLVRLGEEATGEIELTRGLRAVGESYKRVPLFYYVFQNLVKCNNLLIVSAPAKKQAVHFVERDHVSTCNLPPGYHPPVFPAGKNRLGIVYIEPDRMEIRIFPVELSSADRAAEDMKSSLMRQPESVIKLLDLRIPYSNFSAAHRYGKEFQHWLDFNIRIASDGGETVLVLTVHHNDQCSSSWIIDLGRGKPHLQLVSVSHDGFEHISCTLHRVLDHRILFMNKYTTNSSGLSTGVKLHRMILGNGKSK